MYIQAQMARDMLLAPMGTVMIELDREIAAYETMRADLENRHMATVRQRPLPYQANRRSAHHYASFGRIPS